MMDDLAWDFYFILFYFNFLSVTSSLLFWYVLGHTVPASPNTNGRALLIILLGPDMSK